MIGIISSRCSSSRRKNRVSLLSWIERRKMWRVQIGVAQVVLAVGALGLLLDGLDVVRQQALQVEIDAFLGTERAAFCSAAASPAAMGRHGERTRTLGRFGHIWTRFYGLHSGTGTTNIPPRRGFPRPRRTTGHCRTRKYRHLHGETASHPEPIIRRMVRRLASK